MPVVLQKEEIDQVLRTVKETSKEEALTNNLLDEILDFQKRLSEKTHKLESLITTLEGLTWHINDSSQGEILQSLKDLIVLLNSAHSTLTIQYEFYKKFKALNIARKEITAFKYAIDNLKEIGEDLQSVFFSLPNNQDFQNTDKYISNL